MEENHQQDVQEDPVPLTDEEFARFQKKQNRESGIFVTILDFFLSFFQ